MYLDRETLKIKHTLNYKCTRFILSGKCRCLYDHVTGRFLGRRLEEWFVVLPYRKENANSNLNVD